ncbi:hypothetical protein ACJX0J_029113, partial [Zea mays]
MALSAISITQEVTDQNEHKKTSMTSRFSCKIDTEKKMGKNGLVAHVYTLLGVKLKFSLLYHTLNVSYVLDMIRTRIFDFEKSHVG